MKKIILLLALVIGNLSFGQVVTPEQQLVDQFLSEHEVVNSDYYCRQDIKTPECRVLIRYKNKVSGKLVDSFQIAFTAPFRQAGGTEFFLKNTDCSTYTRLADTSVDGKVNVTLEEKEQHVDQTHSNIVIKNIKFGTLIADLEFNPKKAELNGIRDGQPVVLVYPRIK